MRALPCVLALFCLITACGKKTVIVSGPPTEPLTTNIAPVSHVPHESDFATDHPDLPGIPISFNTLAVVFHLETTVEQAQEILDSVQAEIVGGQPGVAGQVPGVLTLRLPASNHEQMQAILNELKQQPEIKYVVPSIQLSGDRIPKTNGGNPASWTWTTAPGGGNWGLEVLRVPQMWNLNAAVTKSGATCRLGIIDSGFASHTDLIFGTNLTPGVSHTHGTTVAGVAGAWFDNGAGVDGLNPFFANQVAYATPYPPDPVALLSNLGDIKVINISMGFGWSSNSINPINPATNLVAQEIAHAAGGVFATAWSAAAAVQGLPLLVVSAGNDSNHFPATPGCHQSQEARYNSPYANAALAHGASGIIVVESVLHQPGATPDTARAEHSNINGHLSAPGVDIVTTNPSNKYVPPRSGTSFAAPHVAALASYLYCVDPGLSHAQILDLLVVNGIAAAPHPSCGGPAPSNRVDAWASVIDIDRVRSNDRVLRMWLDIDDGTPDGNRRVDPGTGTDFTGEDADGDGGIGDGSIDMSDFRRWRDWYLQVTTAPGLALDGSATHLKKDVNGNRAVESAADENIYPRGDFNGDGKLSNLSADIAYIPGALGGVNSDLLVLQSRFSDPNYGMTDLPGLINSVDITIDASNCLNSAGVAKTSSSIRVQGASAPMMVRQQTDANQIEVFTAAVNPTGYTARVEGLSGNGNILSTVEQDFTLALGGDGFWSPVCPLPAEPPPSSGCPCGWLPSHCHVPAPDGSCTLRSDWHDLPECTCI